MTLRMTGLCFDRRGRRAIYEEGEPRSRLATKGSPVLDSAEALLSKAVQRHWLDRPPIQRLGDQHPSPGSLVVGLVPTSCSPLWLPRCWSPFGAAHRFLGRGTTKVSPLLSEVNSFIPSMCGRR